jgi:hypothetical protein
MIPEEGEKSVWRRLIHFKLTTRCPITAIQYLILAMRGKLLRLWQLKDLVGTLLDKVRESCQGVLGVETLDILQGKRTICGITLGNLFF